MDVDPAALFADAKARTRTRGALPDAGLFFVFSASGALAMASVEESASARSPAQRWLSALGV